MFSSATVAILTRERLSLRSRDASVTFALYRGMLPCYRREDTLGEAVSADVIVVGSGVAGLSAALTAAEAGAEVIVCEKQRALGGTSNFFQGTFAVESDMQRASFITYTRDEAFKNIMEYSHWMADPRLVRAIVDESAATIGWLREQGVQFVEVMNNMPDAPRTYTCPRAEEKRWSERWPLRRRLEESP